MWESLLLQKQIQKPVFIDLNWMSYENNRKKNMFTNSNYELCHIRYQKNKQPLI